MSTVELIRATVFVAMVLLVFSAAIRHLLGIWSRRSRRARGEEVAGLGPGQRARRALVLTLAAIGVGCIAYGYFIEPYWLEVVTVRIPTSKLAPGAGPVRLVHLSDLHCDPKARLEQSVIEATREVHPDVILYTGDCINSPEGLPLFRRTMTALAEIAPTYVVKGNYDVWYWSELDRYGGTGAHEIDGDAPVIAVNGAKLMVTGAEYGSSRSMASALRSFRDDAFGIFLYHTPDEIPVVAANGGDLYLAGHTHGGQVALPLYGALITFSRHDKRFEAGLYEVDGMRAYVNRGIGMEGGIMPRVRFWARPELTVFELVPAAE